MMHANPILLPEIVPQQELIDWRNALRREITYSCPAEVREFIEALANKLPDYGRVGQDFVPFTGSELRLANITELGGEKVVDFGVYKVAVPRLAATDEALSMYRIYKRKGRVGLIDYCKAKVKGTELERLLYVLNVHVFHRERPEFREAMDAIYNAKKLVNENV
jgi:hypothetical protein